MTGSPSDSQSKAPEAAVVICAYTNERWNDIASAVESTLSQEGVAFEVVLVVDHNAGLVDRARDHFGDKITIVENRHKRGLSGARNTGVESTTAPIIVFLDDDAKAESGWLETLVRPFDDVDVCGTGGHVEPLWEVPRPGWWPPEFDWVVGCSYIGLPDTKREIRNPIGASMAVRRSAMDASGGFNYGIGRVGKHPVGCEETELFIRIKRNIPTARVLQIPDARVLHRVTAARATAKYFYRRCYAEGISKAVVAQLSGVDDGLASERTYSAVVLPKGVVRNFVKGVRGERIAFRRAAAIVTGLAVTTLGYVRGRLSKGPERTLSPVPSAPGTTDVN